MLFAGNQIPEVISSDYLKFKLVIFVSQRMGTLLLGLLTSHKNVYPLLFYLIFILVLYFLLDV